MALPGLGWLGPLFTAVGQALGLISKTQELKNQPKIVANVDAKRDLDEKDKIQDSVEKSDKTGSLKDEQEHFAED